MGPPTDAVIVPKAERAELNGYRSVRRSDPSSIVSSQVRLAPDQVAAVVHIMEVMLNRRAV